MKKLALLISLGALVTPIFAQVPPPGGVPIDPVSWVLLAAGAGIAGKKYMDKKKKEEQDRGEF